jgi:hypothetical protein
MIFAVGETDGSRSLRGVWQRGTCATGIITEKGAEEKAVTCDSFFTNH